MRGCISSLTSLKRSCQRHLGISAPWAAFAGLVASFVVALVVMRMPVAAAVSAFIAGTLNGAVGIVWIIVGAMLLYTITLGSGKFEIVKESIIALLQAYAFPGVIPTRH